MPRPPNQHLLQDVFEHIPSHLLKAEARQPSHFAARLEERPTDGPQIA